MKNVLLFILPILFFMSCHRPGSEHYEPPVDGKMIFVEAIRGEGWLTANPFGELVMIDSEREIRNVLTADGYYYAHPNLTPDGKRIIFESKRDRRISMVGLSADSHIYEMDIETGEVKNLSEELSERLGEELGMRVEKPSLSPSGEKLAIVRPVTYTNRYFTIVDLVNDTMTDIDLEWSTTPDNSTVIEWSEDEKHINYRVFPKTLIHVNLESRALKVIETPDNLNESDHTVTICYNGSWTSSHNLLYSCRDTGLDRSYIFEYDITESKSTPVRTVDELLIDNIQLIDDNNIMFVAHRNEDRKHDIYHLNLETGNVVQVTNSHRRKGWFRWYE